MKADSVHEYIEDPEYGLRVEQVGIFVADGLDNARTLHSSYNRAKRIKIASAILLWACVTGANIEYGDNINLMTTLGRSEFSLGSLATGYGIYRLVKGGLKDNDNAKRALEGAASLTDPAPQSMLTRICNKWTVSPSDINISPQEWVLNKLSDTERQNLLARREQMY